MISEAPSFTPQRGGAQVSWSSFLATTYVVCRCEDLSRAMPQFDASDVPPFPKLSRIVARHVPGCGYTGRQRRTWKSRENAPMEGTDSDEQLALPNRRGACGPEANQLLDSRRMAHVRLDACFAVRAFACGISLGCSTQSVKTARFLCRLAVFRSCITERNHFAPENCLVLPLRAHGQEGRSVRACQHSQSAPVGRFSPPDLSERAPHETTIRSPSVPAVRPHAPRT